CVQLSALVLVGGGAGRSSDAFVCFVDVLKVWVATSFGVRLEVAMGHGHLDAWGARGRFFTMPAVFDVTEFVAAVAVGLVAVVTAFGAGLDSVAARDLDDRRVDPRAGRALRAGNERFEL